MHFTCLSAAFNYILRVIHFKWSSALFKWYADCTWRLQCIKTTIHCSDMYLNVTLIVQSLYILHWNFHRHVVLLYINLPVKQSTCPTSPATHQSEQSASFPHFILSACLSAHSFTRWQISHCHCLVFVGKLSISGCWQILSAGLFIIIHVEMKTLSAVSRCHYVIIHFLRGRHLQI